MDDMIESKNYSNDVMNSVTEDISNIIVNAAKECNLMQHKKVFDNGISNFQSM